MRSQPSAFSAGLRVGVSATLFFGCGLRSEHMASPTSAEEVRRLVDAWYAAWSLHEPARIDAIFTDDAIYEDVAGGQIHRGKAEIRQLLGAAFAFAPDFRVTLRSLVVAGDAATTEWQIEGTQTGTTGVGSIGELP